MMGRRPYDGRSRREIRNQILAKQAYIRQEMIPKGWSVEAADFTNRLIQRKPYKRLGKQGIHELKNHSWFKGFDWESLINKTMKPPFIPNIKNVFEYLRNLTEDFTEADCSMENSLIIRRNSFQDLFNGYECFPNLEKKNNYFGTKNEKTKEKTSEVSLKKLDSKHTTKGENPKNSKEVRFSNKKIVKAPEPKAKAPESKGKKRISLRKESVERSKEFGNKTVCQNTSKKKSVSKKMKSKKVSSDLLRSKQMSKTLKKNSLALSDIEDKMKRISQKAKRSRQSHEMKWSKEKSKMGVLGKPSNRWEKMSSKSRNVRHIIQKRSALNKSLSKKTKKSQLDYGAGEKKANYSMSSKLKNEEKTEIRCLSKSKQRSKNDLKGYLSLNSKNFYKNAKKSKDKKMISSYKKNQKFLKLKNPRKMIINRGYYVSPQFDRKRDSKKSVFMSSLNYSRFGSKNGYKHNSYSKQSKRSKEQMDSLCLGGNFGNRADIQESLRKASFNGTFFEKMRKFGKKRLQQGRFSNGKKNMSIYLSHNTNNLRKKRLSSHKAQANYGNSGHLLWNKRRKPMGLNLTMIKRSGYPDNLHSTLLENQKSGKGSLRIGNQAFTRGDIYRQLDEFERLKQQRVDLECRQLNSRGSRKGSAFRKKGDLIKEIAEITQSLSCTSNLKKLTSKVQNKENYKQLEKLAQSDGLKSFYSRNQNLSAIRKRSQKHSKRRNLGLISSNLQINNSRLN